MLPISVSTTGLQRRSARPDRDGRVLHRRTVRPGPTPAARLTAETRQALATPRRHGDADVSPCRRHRSHDPPRACGTTATHIRSPLTSSACRQSLCHVVLPRWVAQWAYRSFVRPSMGQGSCVLLGLMSKRQPGIISIRCYKCAMPPLRCVRDYRASQRV